MNAPLSVASRYACNYRHPPYRRKKKLCHEKSLIRWHVFYTFMVMSSAFVKESDDQWLHDIAPTMAALIQYLVRENNGVRVYEKSNYMTPEGIAAHEMSNGFSYALDENSKWYIVEE